MTNRPHLTRIRSQITSLLFAYHKARLLQLGDPSALEIPDAGFATV